MSAVSDEVVALASVRKGRLFIENRRLFDEQIARLNDRWQLEVTVKRMRATRSINQNKFYWGVCVQLVAEHTGYTPEEIHEIFKQMFIPKRLAVQDGNGEIRGEFLMGGSTRGLDTEAFAEFTERVQQWAATELDIYIPDPDERSYGHGV